MADLNPELCGGAVHVGTVAWMLTEAVTALLAPLGPPDDHTPDPPPYR